MLSQHESEKWEVAVIAFICPLQTSWTYTQRWERRGAESISAQATHTSIHTHADEIFFGGGGLNCQLRETFSHFCHERDIFIFIRSQPSESATPSVSLVHFYWRGFLSSSREAKVETLKEPLTTSALPLKSCLLATIVHYLAPVINNNDSCRLLLHPSQTRT